MGRSDGVLTELEQEMQYSKRIRAGMIVLIGHQQRGDWTWGVGNGLNLDKICEPLAYTWAEQMHGILIVHGHES